MEGSCFRQGQKNPGQILGLVKKIPNFVKAIFLKPENVFGINDIYCLG